MATNTVSRNSVVVDFTQTGGDKVERDIKKVGKAANDAQKPIQGLRQRIAALGDRSLGTPIQRLRASLTGLGSAFGSIRLGILSLVGAGGFLYLGKQLINTGDEFAKMSQRVGIATENLSQYKFALEQSGASLQVFEVGLRGLARAIDTASQSTTGVALAFKELGVNVRDQVTGQVRNMEEVMLDVAEALSGLENGGRKAALIMEIFGARATALTPFLNEGRAGIEALRKEADELGLTFSGKTAAASELFNDNLNRLASSIKGVGITILNALLPVLNRLVDGLLVVIRAVSKLYAEFKRLSDFIREFTSSALTERYLQDVGRLVDTLTNRLENLRQIENPTERVVKQIEELEEALVKASFEYDRLSGKFDKPINATIDINANAQGTFELDFRQLEQLAQLREQSINGLTRELALIGAKTKAQQLSFDLEKGALSDLDDASKKIIQDLAKQIDLRTASIKQQEDLAREAELYERQLNPIKQLQKEIERLNELRDLGLLSQETYDKGIERANQNILELNENYSEAKRIIEESISPRDRYLQQLEKINQLTADGLITQQQANFAIAEARREYFQLGDVIANKFADSFLQVINGTKTVTDAFVDMARQIIAEIIKIELRMIALKALGLSTGGGGGGLGGLLSGVFGGGGGIGGLLPFNKFADGGVANSPQLALFGEGSQPEAFVPLPDGKNIPVKLDQRGNSKATTININVQAQDVDSFKRSEGQVLAQLAQAINRVSQRDL